MAFLIGMSDPVRGQKFELNKERITLGRNGSNDIVLTDSAASSHHCVVAQRGNRFVLRDLNSTNGTLLNNQRVSESELKHKQMIQIGATELMFESDVTADSSGILPTSGATQVVIDNAPPIAKPKTFSSVSPFGTRRQESRGVWLAVIVLVGLAALAGLAYFIYKMIHV